MRIHLFVGDGWSPVDSGKLPWPVPGGEEIDWQASIEKLAVVFADRVRDLYSDAEVSVEPAAASHGRLAKVELDESDAAEEADEALALTAGDLAGGGYAPAMLVAAEIEGQLDGIIAERPHTWQIPFAEE